MDLEFFKEHLEKGFFEQAEQADRAMLAFEQVLELNKTFAREEPLGLAHENPIHWFGALIGALAARRPLFLLKPDWSASMRAQAETQLAGLRVLSGSQLEFWGTRKTPPLQLPNFEGCWMMPTGGSTAQLKFVIQKIENVILSAQAYKKFWGDGFEFKVLSVLPLWAVGGLWPLLRSFVSGGTAQFLSLEAMLRRPESLKNHEGAHLSLVSAQLSALLQNEAALKPMRGLGALLLGGGAVSPKLLCAAREQNLPIASAYGLSEAGATVALQRPKDFLAGKALALEPLGHVSLSVHQGRLHLNSSALFEGYFPKRETDLRHFASKDKAALDAKGRLSLLGRFDRIFKSGGESIDASSIEAALLKAGATHALVVGVPDEHWGEQIVAFVEGVELNESWLRAAVAHLEPAARPKRCLLGLPLNAACKPDWALIEKRLKA